LTEWLERKGPSLPLLQLADYAVFFSAIAANLLMVVIFLLRKAGKNDRAIAVGVVFLLLSIPIMAAMVINIVILQPWWKCALLAPILLFMALEWALDYIRRDNFRASRLLGLYLALFYLGLIGLTGYAFSTSKIQGLLTLPPYFANLAAAWYTHAKKPAAGSK
jgi:hypothetical protein